MQLDVTKIHATDLSQSAAAACIVELVEDGDQDAKMSEADKLMQQIPKLTKKIAGKSLPIEVRFSKSSIFFSFFFAIADRHRVEICLSKGAEILIAIFSPFPSCPRAGLRLRIIIKYPSKESS